MHKRRYRYGFKTKREKVKGEKGGQTAQRSDTVGPTKADRTPTIKKRLKRALAVLEDGHGAHRGGAAELKAKLMLKGKFRPEKMVRKKMPDGSGMLAKLPERRKDNGLDAAAADKEYCDAIDKVAAVFGQ